MKQTRIDIAILALGCVPGAFLRWQFDNDLLVNILGSGILGLVFGLSVNTRMNLLIGVGFCGSLTTFSGWMIQTLTLMHSGEFLNAFFLIFWSIGLGLIAAALGFSVGRGLAS